MSCSTHWRNAIGCADRTPELIDRAHCPVERAVDVDAAARIGYDGNREPCLTAVDRRIEHAEISRQAAQGNAFKSAFLEVTYQPRRRAVVVLKERRVGIDRRSKALSQHEL